MPAATMNRLQACALVREAAARSERALSEPQAKQVIAAFGIAVPDGVTVAADASVAPIMTRLRAPLAVKLVSSEGLHKSDIGGLVLGVKTEAELRDALGRLAENGRRAGVRSDGFLVEEMAAAGVELVIGAVRDARFGPVIMFGLGGVHVEVFGDVAFRICPIEREDAVGMIEQLRSKSLLRGARGRPPIDEAALISALLAIGGADGLMMSAAADIGEVDINPLIASGDALLACDARIILGRESTPEASVRTATAVAQDPATTTAALLERYAPLFNPRVIAVVGASATGFAPANEFIRQSMDLGCTARIVPIHPSAGMVEGLPACKSIADIGAVVDYAYVAIAGAQIAPMLEAAAGKIRYAQIISSGFGEVSEGRELEQRLLAAARRAGVRLLGPNCLGLYAPRAGLAFVGDCPSEAGPIGIVSQSGGLAVDMLLRGQTRGLRYSGVATIGNSVDLGPADLLEYYMADPDTRVIGVYVEDIKDGRRFFEVLRSARGRKPVVVLVGGQTDQGRHAAASHTGSLASPVSLWQGLAHQTGLVVSDSLEQFLDVLLAFQMLSARTDRPTRQCVLFGNGGGTSVLAADAFGRRGLQVVPMPGPALARLEALKLPPGTSIVNPIDAPAYTLRQDDGRIAESILETVFELGGADAVVMHLNLPVFIKSANQRVDFLGNLMAAATRVQKRHPAVAHFVLVLRSDGSAICDERKREFRAQAAAHGIPAFDEMTNAADALAAVSAYESFVARS